MANEMSESIEKKSYLMLAAYIAESVTDDSMIIHLKTSIEKYDKAKQAGVDQKKLDSIFMEISLLSYINVVRMIDQKAADLIKDIENVDRVLDLIKPNTN
jgi:ABC-type lipoprotein export system ATPase subunit